MLVVGDHAGPVTALTFMPDGSGLVSGSKDGSVRRWGLRGGPSNLAVSQSTSILSVAVSPIGDWIAVAGGDTLDARVYSADLLQIEKMVGMSAPVTAASFVAGGQWLAVGVGNRDDADVAGKLVIWRSSDGKTMHTHNESNGVWALAAAPEHKFVAWSTGARRVALRDLTRPDPHVFPALKKSATTLAMSLDAQWLAAGDDWSVRVWDITRRDDKANLIGHKGRVLSLAFTPDGRHLLSGAGDQKIITWDIATGQQEHVVDWDLGRVTSVAVSPDGLLCAAGGDRGRVVVWDRDEV